MHPEKREAQMTITRTGSVPSSKGPEENFNGSVFFTPLASTAEHTLAPALLVTFEPGACSAWHIHPAGQRLIVTSGVGWIQEWGHPKREIRAGDVVWTPPNVKHWHGATRTTPMAHIALQEPVKGTAVVWLEKVSDEVYGAPVEP